VGKKSQLMGQEMNYYGCAAAGMYKIVQLGHQYSRVLSWEEKGVGHH